MVRRLGPSIGIVLALAAPKAGADPSAATMLFHEGRQLMAAGNTAKACVRFEQSFALEAASGTLLNLALCHEQQGKTATAWAEYRNAATLARSQDRQDRAAAADQKIAALEPKLARLTLVAPKAVTGLEVSLEEERSGPLHIGVATPLDPGAHRLRANAPGRRPWTATIEIAEAEQRSLEIPELEPSIPALPAVPAPVRPPVLVAQPPAADPTSGSRRPLDLYVAGAGAALVLSGAVVWGIAYSDFQSAKTACNHPPGCADYSDRVSTIHTLEAVAIGAWIAGGAAVLVSGLHYRLTKPPAPVNLAIDPLTRQVAVRGRF
jgi:hypothetical protein